MSRRSASIKSMAAELQPDLYNSLLRPTLTVPAVLHAEESAAQVDGANALRNVLVNALGLTVDKASGTFLPTKCSSRFPIIAAGNSNLRSITKRSISEGTKVSGFAQVQETVNRARICPVVSRVEGV
ncbi:hypothetical protein BBP40_007360 [Aspergillus hancockii]|nr:hypothetical protein BBP40_007360 [Aspergillus hancockii]